jgi:hypothetical protein
MSKTWSAAEVLLIEDNPTDAELCMEALKEFNLYNAIVWVKDGAEALDFLFARGAYANRNTSPPQGRAAGSAPAQSRRHGSAAGDEEQP